MLRQLLMIMWHDRENAPFRIVAKSYARYRRFGYGEMRRKLEHEYATLYPSKSPNVELVIWRNFLKRSHGRELCMQLPAPLRDFCLAGDLERMKFYLEELGAIEEPILEELLLVLALTMGDYALALRRYRQLQRLELDPRRWRRILETLLDYCTPLWRRRRIGYSSDIHHRLEMFQIVWPEWERLGISPGRANVGRLLARMVRHGLMSDKGLIRRQIRWINRDAPLKFEEDYLSVIEDVRRLHRTIAGGEHVTVGELWEMGKRISRLRIKALKRELWYLLEAAAVQLLHRGEAQADEEEMVRLLDLFPNRRNQAFYLDPPSSTTTVPEETEYALELLQEARKPLSEEGVACFLVERNEAERLEGFFSHYRKLGVERFFVLDNGSDDETTLEILRQQPDVTLYYTTDSYALADYGISWVRWMLRRHRREGSWNLVVDADELLLLSEGFSTLKELSRWMEERDADTLGTLLLDLYSRVPLKEVAFKPGLEILEQCRWYDRSVYTTWSPFGGEDRKRALFQGGVRSRTFGIDTVVLNKYPFFRYSDSLRLTEGMHWIEGAKPLYGAGILLHFKYIASFHAYAEREVERAEHWNGASEYQKYHDALQRNPDFSLYDPDLSVPFEGLEAFYRSFPRLWSLGKM